MKVIDLFSGAGGMVEGFSRAGFRCAFANDFDRQAIETFAHNHPETVALQQDIRTLAASSILDSAGVRKGAVDVLCGGPPCQGFSLAGPRIADDPKNQLFLEFVRIAAALEPRAIVFENVVGIASMQGGEVVRAIKQKFSSVGYSTAEKVLNAADFGVPQARFRFIMLGWPTGTPPLDFPAPSHSAVSRQALLGTASTKPHQTVWDALGDLPLIGPGEGDEEMLHPGSYLTDYQRERRGRRKPGMLFNHRAINHGEKIRQRYLAIPEGRDSRDLPTHLRTKKINVWKLDRCRPSRTVTCNHRTDLLHPFLPRGTTVREAARLQSFDDDYRFFGNLTRKAAWVTQDDQVGNAVPPLLAFALAQKVRSYL